MGSLPLSCARLIPESRYGKWREEVKWAKIEVGERNRQWKEDDQSKGGRDQEKVTQEKTEGNRDRESD